METQTPKDKDSAIPVIPCWLCGEAVEVKFSKKDKPYLVCQSCGVQSFIRYDKAEKLLIAKIKQYREGK